MHVPSVHTHISHVRTTSAHVKQVHVMQAHAVYEQGGGQDAWINSNLATNV